MASKLFQRPGRRREAQALKVQRAQSLATERLRAELPRKRPSRVEDALQYATADFLARFAHASVIRHHSANERQGVKAGAKAKRMGQLAGWPDWTLLWPDPSNGDVHLLFIELKEPGNSLSPAQRDFVAALDALHVRHAIAKSLEEFRFLLAKYGVPTANGRDWPRV